MKKIILTISIVLVAFACYSQPKINSLVFSIGPAIPLGDFASKDILSTSSGFAKTGEALSIEYLAQKGKQFGIIARLNVQRNPLNTKAFENAFDQLFNPDFINWKFKKKAWLAGSLSGGGFGQFIVPSDPKLSFVGKLMAGIVYGIFPGLDGKSESANSLGTTKQSDGDALGFIFTLSGGLHYQLKKKTFLSFSIDYLGTNKLTFKDITSTVYLQRGQGPTMQITETSQTQDGKQTMGTLNFYFGIGLRL